MRPVTQPSTLSTPRSRQGTGDVALGRIHRKVLSVCCDPQSRGIHGTVAQANTVAGTEGERHVLGQLHRLAVSQRPG